MLGGGDGAGAERLLGFRAAMVGDHHLAVAQETPSHGYRFVDQPAAVVAQIQNQPGGILFAQLGQIVFHVLGDVLRFKAVDVEINDARLPPERVHHTGFDGAAGDIHGDGVRHSFAPHRNPHLGAARPAQQVGHGGRFQGTGVFIVHGHDHVTAAQVRSRCRRAREGAYHHHVGLIHADLHPHPEILRPLAPLHLAILGRIDEHRVWVEGVQHAGNGALVEGLFRRHRIRVVLFHQREHRGHRAHGAVQFLALRCRVHTAG